MTVEAEAEPLRCFEGEQVTVRITLSYDGEPARLDPGVTLGHGVRLDHLAVGPHRVDLVLTARRWGRWTLGTVEVDVYDPGGSARRTVRAELGDIAVFPLPGHAGLTPIPVRLPQRLVEHTVEQRGEGIEVTGVHRYVRGRRQRRIHRPATTRRGALQVHPFAAERTADTVVLLDVLADVVNPVTDASSLDETFRAAAGLVRAYLRTHDRVGVVSVGGATRWLQPDSGQGYFYRIVESVLEVRKDRAYRTEGLSPLPPPARADPGSPPQDDGAAGGDRGRRSHRPPVWLVVCMAALLPAYLLVTDAWTAGVSAPPDCPRATPALAAAAATAVVLLAAQAPVAATSWARMPASLAIAETTGEVRADLDDTPKTVKAPTTPPASRPVHYKQGVCGWSAEAHTGDLTATAPYRRSRQDRSGLASASAAVSEGVGELVVDHGRAARDARLGRLRMSLGRL